MDGLDECMICPVGSCVCANSYPSWVYEDEDTVEAPEIINQDPHLEEDNDDVINTAPRTPSLLPLVDFLLFPEDEPEIDLSYQPMELDGPLPSPTFSDVPLFDPDGQIFTSFDPLGSPPVDREEEEGDEEEVVIEQWFADFLADPAGLLWTAGPPPPPSEEDQGNEGRRGRPGDWVEVQRAWYYRPAVPPWIARPAQEDEEDEEWAMMEAFRRGYYDGLGF